MSYTAKLAETPAWVPDNIDQCDIPSPIEVQTSMVDSMSPPHATESILARHALARDCTALQLVDKDIEECRMRIARAQAEMLLLERQRNAVQHRMSIHRARLSPLRTVPDQVLQEIFQHCLPDTPYVVPNARSAPLLLAHVCRRWRVVAQGSSELWSSIALYDRGAWNYELEVEMVKRWLDRSHTRPIRMSIACPPRTGFGLHGGPPCSDLFQVAVAHSSRLSTLRLNVDRTYLNQFMNRANLSALRSLVVLSHSEQRISEFPAPGPVIPTSLAAPRLRHVAFEGDRMPINLFPPALFPQITHLSLDCGTPDLARLFRDFFRLERLTLTPRLQPSSPPRSAHRAIGSSLRRLDVRLDADMLEFGDPATSLASVLDPLELPALRALVIAVPVPALRQGVEGKHHVGYEEWVCSPSVRALSSRSRCCARPRLERWDPDGEGRWYEEFESRC